MEDSEKRARSEYMVELPARQTGICLTWVVSVLLGAHVGLSLAHYLWSPLPWLLLRLYDVDAEDSIPNWYSSSALLFASALLFLIASRKMREHDSYTRHWDGLALGFLFMSCDEVAGFHETLHSVLPFSWTIPGLILSLGLALLYIKFLIKLPRKTRFLFMLAGAIFLAGAVGVEWATDPYHEKYGGQNLTYNLFTALEEGLEMYGIVLFIYALLDYMGDGKAVRISLKDG